MNYKHPTAPPRKFNRQKGFSLLEAIVALALISLTGMAVFSWLNQSLGNLSKLERRQTQSQLIANSMSYIQTINPMISPVGSTQLGSLQLTWQSQLIEQPLRSVVKVGLATNYLVGLYTMDITLQDSGQPAYSFSVRQVGYRDLTSNAQN